MARNACGFRGATRMSTTHTPTPWKVTPSHTGRGWNIDGPRLGLALPWLVARTESEEPVDEANAQRIVACVNACAGMADPEATITALVAALTDVLPVLRQYGTVAQLDQARAALQRVAKP